uniref:Uncharacterized protein n=1 Tax=Anguilla anguilla TaxID=7936 RepID=A0A0E9QTD8_ANGAN
MLLLAPSQNAVGHRLFFPSEITRPHVIPPLTPVRETARVTFPTYSLKPQCTVERESERSHPEEKWNLKNS